MERPKFAQAYIAYNPSTQAFSTVPPHISASAGMPLYTYGMPIAMPVSYHPSTGMPMYPVMVAAPMVYPPRKAFTPNPLANRFHTSTAIYSGKNPPRIASSKIPHQTKGPVLNLPPGLKNWCTLEDPILNSMNKGHLPNADLSKAIKIDGLLLNSGIPAGQNLVHQTAMISLSESIYDNMDKSDTPADIVCAIDVSGSMQGEKLRNVKATLKYLLTITENCRVALVLFNESSIQAMNFKVNNKGNRIKISSVIQSISAAGLTSITEGVGKSQKLLSNRKYKHDVSTILLLTDGKHNRGLINNSVLFGKDSSASSNYTMQSFGYGDDHDALLMREIAEFKNGNYYFVSNVHAIAECFGDCIGMITTTLATKISLTATLTSAKSFKSVTIDKLYEPQWRKQLQNEAVVKLSSIYAGMKRDFLIDFTYSDPVRPQPAKPLVFPALTLTLSYQTIGETSSRTIEKSIHSIVYPSSQVKSIKVNQLVHNNLTRVKGADILMNANDLRNVGRGKEALLKLKQLRKTIERNPGLVSDHVMGSMANKVDQITIMLENDLEGKKNKCRTENIMNQQINVFRNQATAPQFDQYMYQNRAQQRFVSQARAIQNNKLSN